MDSGCSFSVGTLIFFACLNDNSGEQQLNGGPDFDLSDVLFGQFDDARLCLQSTEASFN